MLIHMSSFVVADSSSKVPSGILRGKTTWLGSFDECMNTVAKENGKELFRGRYCHASVSLVRHISFPLLSLAYRYSNHNVGLF